VPGLLGTLKTCRHTRLVPLRTFFGLSFVFFVSFGVSLFRHVGEDQPTFTLHGASGVVGRGPLGKIGPDWAMRLGGVKPILIRGEDVVSLRQEGIRLPCPPEGAQVILADGSRLPLDAPVGVHLDHERLSFSPQAPLRPDEGVELRVPLSQVAVLWLTNPSPTRGAARRLRQLLQGRRKRDQVLLLGGDVVEGAVLALDAAGCRIKVGPAGQQVVPRSRLSAIAFSTELLARLQPKGPYGHLVLLGGGRLELASAAIDVDRQRLKGKTLFGAEVSVPLSAVAALDLRQGRTVYLSDVQALEYVTTPFLGISWPLARDASVTGGPLQVGGSCYDKGLGMHAEGRVSYDLAGKYEWFEALAGLEDSAGRRGRVRIAVLVDGHLQKLAEAELIAGKTVPLRLNVHQARRLTLVVHGAGRGDVQARVVWADARLILAR
jgi:hypothetical protein